MKEEIEFIGWKGQLSFKKEDLRNNTKNLPFINLISSGFHTRHRHS